jgi:hypothetical protein
VGLWDSQGRGGRGEQGGSRGKGAGEGNQQSAWIPGSEFEFLLESQVYEAAVEAKQVAQQEAERAKFIVSRSLGARG